VHSPLMKLASGAAAFALCVSSTMATAASAGAPQPVNPLVVVSAYGTPTSAQIVHSQMVAASASAAAAAQSVQTTAYDDDADSYGFDLGTWILLAIGLAALIAGILTLFEDDDLDDIAGSPD